MLATFYSTAVLGIIVWKISSTCNAIIIIIDMPGIINLCFYDIAMHNYDHKAILVKCVI